MTRQLFRCFALAVLALWVIAGAASIHAQAAPRPNAIVSLYDDKSKTVQFLAFAPGKSQPRKLFELPQGLYAEFSADGQFYTAFGQNISTNQPQTFFGRVGQAATTAIPVDKDYAFIGGKFSPDGHYLAYALAQQPSENGPNPGQLNWALVMLDLTNNQVMRFSGPIVYPTDPNGTPMPKPAVGFYFAPLPSAWSGDSSHLYISIYAPFSDGGPGDLYVLDVNTVKGKTGDQPLPPVTPLPRANIPAFALTQLSPDATKVAYIFNDPKRPVPNYQGMFEAPNTINLVDIATGKVLASVESVKDQAFGFSPTWTADSNTFVYVAGAFKGDAASGTSTMVSPRLYMLNAAGQASNGIVLATEQEGEVQAMLACSDSLFYSIVKNGQAGSTFTLYSAPLTDLKARSAPLLTSSAYLQLMACTP